MFKNLKEFIATMPGEKECREFIEAARWNGSPFCPHCSSTKPYKLKDGRTYRCSNKKCKKDFTVTVKTVMENSNIKLSTWLAAIYIVSSHKKGMSSLQLSRDLGVRQSTAWFLLHRIRHAMGCTPDDKLDGVVEVDEKYVGGRLEKMTQSRRKRIKESGKDNKTPIMGLLERGGKAKLTVIGIRDFKDIIKENVHPTATIMTDSHVSYQGLERDFAGHEAVNHSQLEFKRGEAHTNSIEGLFSLFGRSIIGIYHYISPKHLQRYCTETTYRFNTRKISDKERFIKTVSNLEGRLKYKDLIKE